jgi:hypothetical protein
LPSIAAASGAHHEISRLQRRTLMLLAVVVPLAVLFVYVALRSGRWRRWP